LTSLTDKKENTRWLATYSLAELAPESQEAVQGLLKATQDPATKVRIGAVYALGEIGPFAKSAKKDLQNLHDTTTDAELKTAIEATLLKIVKSN
jgi:Lon protease-like protein